MSNLEDLELIIESGIPVVVIETAEEQRVETLFQRLSTRLGKPVFRWSVASGLIPLNSGRKSQVPEQNPVNALQQVARSSEGGLYLFFDIHPWLDNPVVIRILREIAQRHQQTPHCLILVGPALETPAELRNLTARFEFTLPSLPELEELIHQESAEWGKKNRRRVQASRQVVDALARNLAGLTLAEARRILRRIIYDDGMLTEEDIDATAKAKYEILDTGGVLSFEMRTYLWP